MAKRFNDSGKFNDPWYRKLSPVCKCIWEYANSSCDHAGFLKLDLELMSFQIGSEITLDDLKKFGDRFIFISEEIIHIPKFIIFQYGVLNPENKVHKSVLHLLEKNNILAPSKPLGSTFQGTKDKIKDKDIINLFNVEYEKVFKKIPMLEDTEKEKIVQVSSWENYQAMLPEILLKLKGLKFEKIDFVPSANWLLKENNFSKMANGEFDKMTSYKKPKAVCNPVDEPEEVEEHLGAEELKKFREKAFKGHTGR